MSETFFTQLEIPKPHYNLGIQETNAANRLAKMIEGISNAIEKEKPQALLVYGDTDSTLAGALAANKNKIPLIHVESGLRSYNKTMPEEVNRILTDHLSDLLFCPSQAAVNNLEKENISGKEKVIISEDIMLDCLLNFLPLSIFKDYFQEKKLEKNSYILATIHRAENTTNSKILFEIISAFNEINLKTPIILPLHPRTQKIIDEQGMNITFKVIPPVSYFEMLGLIQNSLFVMTDSGGLQKEAYWLEKRCITLRPETEWTELVSSEVNTLPEALNKNAILSASEKTFELLNKKGGHWPKGIYGTGNSARNISKKIEKFLLDKQN
jgi:UDP-GlcNAc3NAcA epimerase